MRTYIREIFSDTISSNHPAERPISDRINGNRVGKVKNVFCALQVSQTCVEYHYLELINMLNSVLRRSMIFEVEQHDVKLGKEPTRHL